MASDEIELTELGVDSLPQWAVGEVVNFAGIGEHKITRRERSADRLCFVYYGVPVEP